MRMEQVLKTIHDGLFIGIVRDEAVERSVAHADAYVEGGFRALEISSASAAPSQVIGALKRRYGDRVAVGAGTVLDAVTARIMMLSGADYIAAPSFSPEVAQMCSLYGAFYMPTCFTSNEIALAMGHGIRIVKLFPGELYPAGTALTIKKMYDGLEIIAAGGVSHDNLEEWVDIGVWAVGAALPGDSPERVKADARTLVEKLRGLKRPAAGQEGLS